MISISIYEQELFGTIHWRVMRDDGRLIFDRHQTDFPNRDEAIAAVRGTFRREKLGNGQIRVYGIDRQGGRAAPKSILPIETV